MKLLLAMVTVASAYVAPMAPRVSAVASASVLDDLEGDQKPLPVTVWVRDHEVLTSRLANYSGIRAK